MKKMVPLIIAIFSAVLSILAAWYQYQIKEDERKEKNVQKQKAQENEKLALEFQTKLIQKTESLDSANLEIRDLQSKLLDKTNSLLEENKTVQETQAETIKFMTGEGAPILNFYNIGKGAHSIIFFNRTNYPIYDMRVRIDDFDEMIKCDPIINADIVYLERECVLKISKHAGPIFMAPGQNSPINFQMKFIGRKHFRIEILTRNDIYEYLCIVEKQEKTIKYCLRLYHQKKGKAILKDQQEHGLKLPEDKYWNENFFADKTLYFGPTKYLFNLPEE